MSHADWATLAVAAMLSKLIRNAGIERARMTLALKRSP
jgi:hypothetical protein